MLRSLFVLTSVASVEASRVQVVSHSALEAKWGASCDSLQNRFHTQVQTCQTALNAANSAESTSTVSQGRLLMRMYGLVRTLRRAQECDWVVENNSEDLEEMRGMTQQLIAENPCGEAAQAEFEAGAADESLQAIARALSILASDNCEASEIHESQEESSQDIEGQVQDEIDALMDAEEEGGAAFIQKSQSRSFGGFMRRVAVFFMTLFLVLVCATSVAIIAVILTYIVMSLIITIPAGPAGMGVGMGLAMDSLAYGLVGGGVIGLAGCASQLYSNFATIH